MVIIVCVFRPIFQELCVYINHFHQMLVRDLIVLCMLVLHASHADGKDLSERIITRPSQFTAQDVAVVFNAADPASEEVARYYVQARQIPASNVIAVTLPMPAKEVLSVEQFEALKAQIDAKIGQQQVLLLVWRAPFAVQCNSLTSALTLGLDLNQCAKTCDPGRDNPYFNSASLRPLADYQIRLSMLLPVTSIHAAKALIDRGVLSEFSLNEGHAYFVKTSDPNRSKPREPFFPDDGVTISSKRLTLHTLNTDAVEHQNDVMFYFTGAIQVQGLDSNHYLPGAVADHLTSTGGILREHGPQMPATRWLEAGLTGSYGSVSEPCNYWQKFPNPTVMLVHYLAGETLVEAYWKSVKWPAQGLFIGEPLAKPYARSLRPQ